MHWNFTRSVLKVYRNCNTTVTGAVLQLYSNCIATVMEVYWKFTETVLELNYNYY